MVYILTFAAEIVNDSSILLYWTGKYDTVTVKQSIDNQSFTNILENKNQANVSVSVLLPNTAYYFIIIPYDEYENAGVTRRINITTPTNIELTDFYAGLSYTTSIPLYWTGIFYKTSISVTAGEGEASAAVGASVVFGASSVVIGGLEPDTSYNFEITPYDFFDVSGTSFSISTKTDYLAYINNIEVTEIFSNSVDISWNGLYSTANIQYSADEGVHYTTISNIYSVNTGVYTYNSLAMSTTYYFRVIPYNDNCNPGEPSAVVSAKTQ
jgi:hypothetical protein